MAWVFHLSGLAQKTDCPDQSQGSREVEMAGIEPASETFVQ